MQRRHARRRRSTRPIGRTQGGPGRWPEPCAAAGRRQGCGRSGERRPCPRRSWSGRMQRSRRRPRPGRPVGNGSISSWHRAGSSDADRQHIRRPRRAPRRPGRAGPRQPSAQRSAHTLSRRSRSTNHPTPPTRSRRPPAQPGERTQRSENASAEGTLSAAPEQVTFELVVPVASTPAFAPSRAAPRCVLVASRRAAARRLLCPCDASARDAARCDRTYGGNHP